MSGEAPLGLTEIGPLLRALDDDDPAVVVATLRATVRLPLAAEAWERVAWLTRTLLDEDASRLGDRLRLEVIRCAAYVPLMTMRHYLHALARQPDAAGRAAANALAAARDVAGAGPLEDVLLVSPSPFERAEAARSLAMLDLPPGSDVLQQACTSDPDGDVRFWSSVALARHGEAEGLLHFLDALDADAVGEWSGLGDPHELTARIGEVGPVPLSVAVRLLDRSAADQSSLAHRIVEALQPRLPWAGERAAVGDVPRSASEIAHSQEDSTLVTRMFENVRSDDPLAGNNIVSLVRDYRTPFVPDVPALFRIYARLRERSPQIGWQIAWVVSRAQLGRIIGDLAPVLTRASDPRRVLAAMLIEEAQRYAGDAFPPLFGGGGGPGDVAPQTRPIDSVAPANRVSIDYEPTASAAPAASEPSPAFESAEDFEFLGRNAESEGDVARRGGAAVAPEVLRRTPHMDVDATGPVAPGTQLEVRVWADTSAAQEGERSEEIEIRAPADVTRFGVDVWFLTSEHFEVIESGVAKLVIERSEPTSPTVTFRARVRAEDDLRARAAEVDTIRRGTLTAVFAYRGRPSGRVERGVEIDVRVDEGEAPAVRTVAGGDVTAPSTAARLIVDHTAQRPDLLVHVVREELDSQQRFKCRVETPLLPERPGEYERWVLSANSADLVSSYMAEFTARIVGDEAEQRATRLRRLRGAGMRLFDAAPAGFKHTFWELIDAGQPPGSISIVSEEPCIPWELMIPHREVDGRKEKREPLGVEFAVGRLVRRDSVSAPQALELASCYVISPTYQGRRVLKHAAAEATFVLESFNGTPIQPARFSRFVEELQQRPVGLIHFCCHGAQGTPVSQAIYLDGEQELTTTELRGADLESAFSQSTPLVFMNACEVGRPSPALVGVGGFAATFLELGAGAVVAALWSVADDVAGHVAREFYDRVKREPQLPYAEILRQIRSRAYGSAVGAQLTAGQDSYAAYCFYGDPRAAAAL